MDPRHIRVAAFGEPSDEERERPPMWRYWRELPRRERSAFSSAIGIPIPSRPRLSQNEAVGVDREHRTDRALREMLTTKARSSSSSGFTCRRRNRRSASRRWKKNGDALAGDKTDWRHFKLYDRLREVAELALLQTGSASAPWIVVEGEDARTHLTVGRALLAAMRERLDQKPAKPAVDRIAPISPRIDKRDITWRPRPYLKLDRKRYTEQRALYQGRLNLLSRNPSFRERSAILVFEGNDAAQRRRNPPRRGRARRPLLPHHSGGRTDRRGACPALPLAFWRHIPRVGRFALFDRSWYGACWWSGSKAWPASSTGRAYSEINDFEQQLADNGAIVIKFWLAISKDEQYALQGTPADRVQALQDHARGLAQPQEMGSLRTGGVRHGGPHLYRRGRTMDSGGSNDKLYARIRC